MASNAPERRTSVKATRTILKERRGKWEAEQLAKFAAAGKQPPKNWQAKYVEPTPSETANLPDLPDGWHWAKLETLADLVGGITKDQKRVNLPGTRQVPYLRVANVQRGFLDLKEIKEIVASETDISDLRLQTGDVLFTEGGDRDKLGRGWVWEGELPECIHQNHIFRARLFLSEMQPRFVSHHGNTFGRDWFIRAGKQTTNLASINLGILRQFPIPIPPAAEQEAIVAQLDEKLSQMEAAEVAIDHGLLRATRLRQSIFKQAFEGNLVSQDPADEPASVLLARIQRQRPVTTAKSAGQDPQPVHKVPREIFMRRAAVVSYTVRRLASHPSFGRTQLEKAVHLTQSHLGVELGFAFERYAAGPFDRDIFRLEAIAKKNKWFTTEKRPTFGVCYRPGVKIDDICKYAPGYLGPKQAELDSLLDQIARMTTDQAELFATAYAAWNDLLIDRRPVDEESIIAEIHGWHEKKQRFKPQRIQSALQWMRERGYVPSGKGQRTQALCRPTHLRSRRVSAKRRASQADGGE